MNRAADHAPMMPVPCAIAGITRETHDSFTLELVPPGGRLPFLPGQFNMLYVFGVGEVPISVSGDARVPERLLHTIRSVGTVTRRLGELAVGDAVGVRGPFGTPWPMDAACGRDLLLIAGGIGLAPLRPALYHALSHRERYQRIVLLYGTRTPRDILFDDELMAWRGRFDLDIEVTVDRGDSAWKGKTGVVTRLLERADFDRESALVMVCGPEIMMRFVAHELAGQGTPFDHIYVTLERNMQCAVAHCGHCQMGPELICRDGAVYRYDRVSRLFGVREV